MITDDVMSRILKLEDLSDASLTRLFAARYAADFVDVEAKLDGSGAFGELSGVNDNYNSEIKTTAIHIEKRPKTGDGDEEAKKITVSEMTK